MDEHKNDQIDPDVLRLALAKSWQLAGKYGFRFHDAEDIQQELVLDYLRRLRSFKPNRCNRRTFAALVIRNRISTLIAERSATSRGYRARHIAIDEPTDGPFSDLGIARTASSALIDHREGIFPEERRVQQIDTTRVLEHLATPLRRICALLMICDDISEVASKAGISRATLYRRLVAIRAAFLQAKLHQ
jgi:RNA polymerase sigma factor (sigma-70 family)